MGFSKINKAAARSLRKAMGLFRQGFRSAAFRFGRHGQWNSMGRGRHSSIQRARNAAAMRMAPV